MRFNPVLDKLTPYKAGPSLAEIRERYGLDQMALMSANEIPWGPFPEVVDALKAAVEGLNRYPDAQCGALRTLLAERLKVPQGQLSFGNGSCELLMLLGHALLGPQRHAVIPHPSFVLYRSIASSLGGPFTAVPLKDLGHDLEAMAAEVRSDTSLLIICNPNNPTGSYVEPSRIRTLLAEVPEDMVVLLDEAYGEFVTSPDREDTAAWISEHPNLVILRTFSKIYGLAGLRLGYAIADPQVVSALDKIRQPFNVDSLAQVAALESLKHPERLVERRDVIATERIRVAKRLAEMGISSHPTQANFLLVDVTGLDMPGPEVPQALLTMGVLIRSGYSMDCPGWIRVTIGEAREGDLFLEAMERLRRGKVRLEVGDIKDAPDADFLSPAS